MNGDRLRRPSFGAAPVSAQIAVPVIVGAIVIGYLIPSFPVVGYVVAGLIVGASFLLLAVLRSSFLLAASLLPLSLALLLPRTLEAAAEAMLVLAAVSNTVQAAYRHDKRAYAGFACLAVPLAWLLLGLNPNVPSMSVILLGVRKSTLVFVGLALGATWPARTAARAERLIIALLLGGGAISLGLHVVLPGVEKGLTRTAGLYTTLFHGSLRLEGIYSGPFHVALLGSFLILRAWHLSLYQRDKQRAWILALLAIGVPLVVLAEVRTAYLTLGAGVLLTLIASRRGRRLRALVAVALLGVFVASLFLSGAASNTALSSIGNLQSDNRATTRLSSISTGIGQFARSPLIGNGPGAAGAGDSSQFVGKTHVTADNEFLALLDEGGLIGAAVVAGAVLVVVRLARRSTVANPERASSAALYCLAAFATTINVFEANPVSTLLAVLVGLSVAERAATSQRLRMED